MKKTTLFYRDLKMSAKDRVFGGPGDIVTILEENSRHVILLFKGCICLDHFEFIHFLGKYDYDEI